MQLARSRHASAFCGSATVRFRIAYSICAYSSFVIVLSDSN